MKRLKLCSQFKYLGSYISSSASLDQEIQIRKQRMQSAYDQYSAQYFENRHVTLWQKLLLFNVTIIPNAIQNCVAWDYNEWHIQQLEFKQLSLLKRIMLQGNYDQFNILHAIRIAVRRLISPGVFGLSIDVWLKSIASGLYKAVIPRC